MNQEDRLPVIRPHDTVEHPFDTASFLKNLPELPGVYRMMDADGKVLYVGKAVNLKRRVSGYFQKNETSPRIRLMLSHVERVEITVTRSEAEALILENNYIKSLSPKYNILFRDDKSYPYLMLSGHEFPRIAYYRGAPLKPDRYFGPYPNAYAVKDSIQLLQKIFQLRTCEDSVFSHRNRPCLLHQIKCCLAPCVGAVSSEHYTEQVRRAVDVLDGKSAQVIDEMSQQMQVAAQGLNFEEAAQWRDRIRALSVVQSKQFVDSANANGADVDILATAEEGGIVCVHWVGVRGGRHVGDKSFFPDVRHRLDETWEDYGVFFVAQHYLGRAKPAVIISNFELPESLKQAINQESEQPVRFINKTLGERKVWLQMAERNAKIALMQHTQQHANRENRLAALMQALQLPLLRRIECFDISHTQGEAAVASCVVCVEGEMRPEQYRRFNVKPATGGDDYAAMREALSRRYREVVDSALLPDLVLIDGGKGQVQVALEVWEALGLNIPLVGIAKGVERKAGQEELIIPHLGLVHRLAPHSLALHLLQTIRDEAHRFAISGHRHKRNAARMKSSLEDIVGVGPKRRRALLMTLGGLRGVMAASVEDLARVEGVSLALAQKIYAALHG